MQRNSRRKLNTVDTSRLAKVRNQAKAEFPPKAKSKAVIKLPGDSIATRLRDARESQGLTWYAVAKAAGIPNSGTIRDIEAGRDAKLSNVEAVAKALGLRLELRSVG